MDLNLLIEEYNNIKEKDAENNNIDSDSNHIHSSNSQNNFKDFVYKRNLEINYDILNKLELDEEELYNFLSKLKEYKYIDEVDDLKYGGFIRWIPLIDPENLPLHHSGMICEIKFTNEGTTIVCKNFLHRHYTIKMDECLIFQKFTNDEKNMIELLNEGI